jgi:hypothetical protein
LKAINELYARFCDAWNRGGGGLRRLHYVRRRLFMGQHLKGIKQITDVHRMLFQEWKLTAFHNYRIQEMPRGEELTMDYGLNGRVVLISGGSRGIGKATGMA